MKTLAIILGALAIIALAPAISIDYTLRAEKAMVRAPEFPRGVDWLNTETPLTIAGLRGKIVLLDFWTYCCINCMHIIPDLKRLEEEFSDELVVIGVHSAKFLQEKDSDNIREAILRYEIKHPVVNDSDFRIWKEYGAQAWPTVALIDPEGYLVGTVSGEGVYNRFADPIRQLIKLHDERKTLDRKPINFTLEQETAGSQILSYPGKILAGVASNRLFISDQNHNRVVVANISSGEVSETIGAGTIGFRDGAFAEARFNHPQGMALDGSKLYIADTENHAVRVADLDTREVSTLAGNGKQAAYQQSAGDGNDISLNSPWDLAIRDGILYVAMAGSHQIWTIRLKDGWAEPFAGNSREGINDGSRRNAWLAQPSGLWIEDDRLYFADSEVSAIRYVELESVNDKVVTVVGTGLFDFGDRDGKFSRTLLQHPLGVAVDGNVIYVADTYNSKIKKLDLTTQESSTLFGSDKPGSKDGKWAKSRLSEPGGIDHAGNLLYIADTNNHRIAVADLTTGELKTLDIHYQKAKIQPQDNNSAMLQLSVRSGAVDLRLEFALPKGIKLNNESPLTLEISRNPALAFRSGKQSESVTVKDGEIISFDCAASSGEQEIHLTVSYVVCEDSGLCRPVEAEITVKLSVSDESEQSVLILPIGR